MSDIHTKFLQTIAIVALGTSAATAIGQTKKPKTAATPAPATQTAPAAVVPAKPIELTPAQKFAQGEAYADANYEKLLPPLPAVVFVAPDRSPPQQSGIHIGIGSHPQNPTQGLISGVCKELDTFVKKAEELKEKSAFVAGGDPYQNGVNVKSARIFAISAQDQMDNFKQITALEQFLTQSDRHDIAMKVAIPTRDANYTVPYKVDPNSAVKMLQDTIDQAEGLALGLRTSIGEYKSAQKSGGFLGNITAEIKNGGRTQNRVYTADEANKANMMSSRLKQTEAAFGAMLGLPGASGPANPYATPPAQQPANPYSPSAQPPVQPTSPKGAPHSKLELLLVPVNTGSTLSLG